MPFYKAIQIADIKKRNKINNGGEKKVIGRKNFQKIIPIMLDC